jgi:small GTP-binding protein
VSQLVETLGLFFGRVEILARGAEQNRRDAEMALARDRPLEAREHAREMLAKVPGSPLALALWADAAERAWLDHEVVEALGALAKTVPWRADVWLRLGRAAQRLGRTDAREALERAASASEERDASREALLDLCDLDLAAFDVARARQWLDSIPRPMTGEIDPGVSLRRAECAVAASDAAHAIEALDGLRDPDGRPDMLGRLALVRARLAILRGEVASVGPERSKALASAVRAFLLAAPGAAELLSWFVAASRDAAEIAELREIVTGMDEGPSPMWESAFALAEGRRDDARRALVRALGAGDPRAASALAALAIEARDGTVVDALVAHDASSVPPELRAVGEIARAIGQGSPDASAIGAALDRLDEVTTKDLAVWANELRAAATLVWTSGEVAHWPEVLGELRRASRALDRVDLLGAIEALALERERPLRAAVVGEFNAGKSTFLNALLGEDVAPTGILPTTGTLHWVSWAPDPFARVAVRGDSDRVVPHAGLKAALSELLDAKKVVERVFIYAPIERLRRVEIIDTPGFNAPDPEHAKAARTAFEEAHLILWLLDASQPLKDPERVVMEQAKQLGLPILTLLNKVDRLKPEQVEQVLAHVTAGLAEAGLQVLAPPLAMSAREALKGRLGDEAALERSRWNDVEALLARELVDRSAALKEGALRRRAARIAQTLATVAEERESAETGRVELAARTSETRRAAARTLAARAAEVAGSLETELEATRRALAHDLRPLHNLPEGALARDPGLAAYVATRFVDRFAVPVSDALARASDLPLSPRAIEAVRAVLAGAAANVAPTVDPSTIPLTRVWMAATHAFSRAAAEDAAPSLEARPLRAQRARLAALVAALVSG